MTTKPKAKKFRIRRTTRGAAPAQSPSSTAAVDETTQDNAAPAEPAQREPVKLSPRRVSPAGDQQQTQPQAQPQSDTTPTTRTDDAQAEQPEAPKPDGASVDDEIEAIRKEGLSGRQLRLARRVAQKQGLTPANDLDAVRQLRAAGIDPFKRSSMLDLIVADGAGQTQPQKVTSTQVAVAGNSLPDKPAAAPDQLPQNELSPSERRAIEISEIQKDISRRRRRKLFLLMTRLAFFVFLPTIACGWYFYTMATPMYATKAEFLVMQADGAGGAGLGGLLSGTQFATSQDSIATQSYLQSRDAMKRLDEDMGFKAHFSQDFIDPIQRLPENATDEEAYKLYRKDVKIGYDPTEGVIRMEVVAADPEVSANFSTHLIDYAEERVDQLSREKRDDQLKEARESLQKVQQERRVAQEKLVQLQENTVLDPEGEIASIRGLIARLEERLLTKKLELNSLMANQRPNRAKVDSIETEIKLIGEELDIQNSRLNSATEGEDSLAQKASQIAILQADLATADLFVQTALQNLKQTELEANRQVRYLTTSVHPVPPDQPTYPRKFENTIVSFLIFSGIYLMISLTASILREQVSS